MPRAHKTSTYTLAYIHKQVSNGSFFNQILSTWLTLHTRWRSTSLFKRKLILLKVVKRAFDLFLFKEQHLARFFFSLVCFYTLFCTLCPSALECEHSKTDIKLHRTTGNIVRKSFITSYTAYRGIIFPCVLLYII